METREKFEMMDLLNSVGTHGIYYRAENMRVSHFKGFDDWHLADLTNALLPGKSCRTYSLKCRAPHGHLIVSNWIARTFKNDIRALFSFCEGLEFPVGQWGQEAFEIKNEEADIEVYQGTEQGVRVFSPFNLSILKPLKSAPAKWTLRHVHAALANKQFKALKCTGYYSDDYAFDASVDYRKGEISAPLDFLEQIITSPSGWRCYSYEGKVVVNCHHFDNNEFIPVIA